MLGRPPPAPKLGPARRDGPAPPLHAPSGPAVRSLAGGLAAAVAVVVLPSIVAQDAGGFKGRFAVAAAIGGAGSAGLFSPRRPPPPPVAAGGGNHGRRGRPSPGRARGR